MYKYRKLVISLTLSLIFSLLFTLTAFAASAEYGLFVDVTTDKPGYSADNTAHVRVTVENTNNFEVKNVTVQHVIPAGLKQIGSAELKKTKNLAAREKIEFNIDVALSGLLSTPDSNNPGSSITDKDSSPGNKTPNDTNSSGSTATNTDTSSSGDNSTDKSSNGSGSDSDKASRSGNTPSTGDNSNALFWMIILAVSAAILIVLIIRRKQSGKKKTTTTILSFFLCVALTLTAIPLLPGNAVSAESNSKSFEVTKTFNIGNDNYTYKVIVSYEDGGNRATVSDNNFDSFHTASLGRAGESSVNDFNGDLTHTFTDFAMSGNRLPIAVSHIYNLQGDDYNGTYAGMKLGKGWRLDTLEQIVPTGLSAFPYRVIDEYGESHYFKRALRENGPDTNGNPYEDHSFVEKDSIESDPDMIPWGFREETDTSGKLTGFHMFKSDFSEYIYNADGYLVKVIDPDGIDARVYTYTNERLTKITDPVGREVTFTYDAKGYLTKMTDPSGREMVYGYDTAKDTLTKVTYPDGKVVSFAYDSKNALTSVTDIDNAKLEYEYTNGRISKLTDKGTEGGLDFYYSFVYKKLETVVTDDEGEIETITFNSDGSVRYGNDGSTGDSSSDSDSTKDTIRNEYNDNKDLVKTLEKNDDDNWIVTYEAKYDGKHNVLWEISEGTKTSYTYDAFSNVLKKQVEKVSQSASAKVSSKASTQDSQITSVEEWEYSSDGNYLAKYTDTTGTTIKYDYNTSKGTLNNIEDANGNRTELTYDLNTDKVLSISCNEISDAVTLENDNISTLSASNGTTFNFSYDQFGNQTETKIGMSRLVKKDYDSNRRVTKTSYGNGQYTESSYGSSDKITSLKSSGIEKYKWTYDENGDITKIVDLVNNVIWDQSSGKITGSNGVEFSRQSQEDGSDFTKNVYLNNVQSKNEFSYDSSGQLHTQIISGKTGATQDQNTTVEYKYTPSKSLKSKIIKNNSAIVSETVYTYANTYQGLETSRISGIQNSGSNTSFEYEYDANGNITTIKDQNTNTPRICYTYNGLNWLIREDNSYADKTYVYEYDKGGNISEKKSYAYTTSTLGIVQDTISYVYGASNLIGWNDVLSRYDDKQLTYDGMGNPLTYDGDTFTWENGRQLAGISGNGKTIAYKYNADGIRVQKTVNGTITDYVVDGFGAIMQERTGNDSKVFEYDSNGMLLSMKHNDAVYYYILNLQGDVIGLIDSSGAKVAEYVYDAWGNIISSSGAIADVNPFFYRGYYRDTENGLYYLQSRYYNSQWGRFINADEEFDSGTGLVKANLFAYVGNNPIMNIDSSGKFVMIIGMIIGAIIVGTLGGVLGYELSKSWNVPKGERWKYVLGGVLIGAAVGAVIGGAIGYALAPSANASGLVLWSGAGNKSVFTAAAQFAKTHGLKVLETTPRGQILGFLNKSATKLLGHTKAYNLMRPFWDAASAQFAKTATGTVHIFLNAGGIKFESTFLTIEYWIIRDLGVKMVIHFIN